jgi:hypothetical protein
MDKAENARSIRVGPGTPAWTCSTRRPRRERETKTNHGGTESTKKAFCARIAREDKMTP